ncbi:MAG: hypothetical protein AAGH65_02585 [Pseudomonadota bacterium]
MKKNKIAVAITAAIMMSASVLMADNHEQETMKLNMGSIKVKMGHGMEFREGIAAWKDCYLENDGDSQWSVFERQDGESGHYYVNFRMAKWGEMDEDSPASEACGSIVQEQIAPHMESSSWRWAESMPEVSKDEGTGNIFLVYYFRVKGGMGMQFNSVVEQVTAATEAIEGDQGGYWYELYGGDEHAADYLVAVPFENYAEWDEDEPGAWEMAAEHYGEEKATELRAQFSESLDAGWDYTYERIDELSNVSDD